MMGRINEVVLNAIKQYNVEFNKLSIQNNIVSLENESINLEDFNLESLFDSYQLKLDLQNMTAKDLFNIIQINAKMFNINKRKEQ